VEDEIHFGQPLTDVLAGRLCDREPDLDPALGSSMIPWVFLKLIPDSFERRRAWLGQATRDPKVAHPGDDDRVGAEQHRGSVLVITSSGPRGDPILAERVGGRWPNR